MGNAPKPLRVFLQVGEHDNGYTNSEDSHHNWVMANERVAAALKAKNYHYRSVFSKGAGHCDGGPIRQTLPDTPGAKKARSANPVHGDASEAIASFARVPCARERRAPCSANGLVKCNGVWEVHG